MNAPISFTTLKPLCLAEVIFTDKPPEIPADTLSPIEADIAREDRLEASQRTASAREVLETLCLSKHTIASVGHDQFQQWLSVNEWPEEQREYFTLEPGFNYLLKMFKSHDSFASKLVPVMEGGRVDSRSPVIHHIYTLVK